MLNNQSLQLFYGQLSQLARQSNFESILTTAFGNGINRNKVRQLQQQWLRGDFSIVPPINVLSQGELGRANGGYAAALDRIFLSSDFLLAQQSNPAAIVGVLIEELGHKLDVFFNGDRDSAGDEGDIFSTLAMGGTLSAEMLAVLRVENDHAVIQVGGELVAIEQAVINGTFFSDILFGTGEDDSINGYAGHDELDGFMGSDSLDGGHGNDILGGGGGNDFLYGREGTDFLFGNSGMDVLFGGAENDFLYGADGNVPNNLIINDRDVLYGEDGDDQLFGEYGDDFLYGGIGNDLLRGGLDNDALYGESGNDSLYADDGNDSLVGGGGDDTLLGGIGSDTLEGGDNNDVIAGGEGSDFLYGGAGNDYLYGGTGNDYISGGGGNDIITASGDPIYGTFAPSTDIAYIEGGGGDDFIRGSVNNNINGGLGADTVYGGFGNDALYGGAGNDVLYGDGNNDYLDGGEDNDLLYGGLGSDTLVGGIGIDSLFGGDGDDNITSDGDGGTYYGNESNDLMFSSLGYETMDGGEGVDVINHTAWYGDYSFNIATGATNWVGEIFTNFENVYMGSGNDTVTGSNTDNTIDGQNGNDRIYGEAGNDVLYGRAGNDILDGGLGADIMDGGAGKDAYIVDSIGDVVIETVVSTIGSLIDNPEGDVVFSYINYTLSDNVERLDLNGGAIIGVGNNSDNFIFGNSANNIFNGLGGNDYVEGGAGADTYYVDTTGDVVVEDIVSTATTELDVVYSRAVGYTIGANVEHLYLEHDAISGTGNNANNKLIGVNSLNNSLYGLDGNDTLDGGNGIDTLNGGAGADIYYVNHTGDIINESTVSNAKTELDVVYSTTYSYTISANVERLYLSTGAVSGTGNATNNYLLGNTSGNSLSGLAGNDILNGLAGADTMNGGSGADIYYVDTTGDLVTETTVSTAAMELDIVYSTAVDYTISSNVEHLYLSTRAVSGTGNASDNRIIGNADSNTLDGLGGNDYLDGGTGVAIDTFVLHKAMGLDTIANFTTGDILRASASEFGGGLTKGVLDASRFLAGVGTTSAVNSSQRFIFNTSNRALYFDVDGFGGKASVQIATVTGTLPLTNANFLIAV
jgi:Ca2+-binding RTX toxin-like protein